MNVGGKLKDQTCVMVELVFVTRVNLTRILRAYYRALNTSLLPFRESSTEQNDSLSAAMRYRLAFKSLFNY